MGLELAQGNILGLETSIAYIGSVAKAVQRPGGSWCLGPGGRLAISCLIFALIYSSFSFLND